MRLSALAWISLALSAGCLRLGYGPDPSKRDSSIDAGRTQSDAAAPDAGSDADGGRILDGGRMDAAVGGDAAVLAPRDSGSVAMDAGTDAGVMLDAGAPDAGPVDSGAVDAGTTPPADSGTADVPDPRWTEDCPGVPSILFCDDFEDSLSKWSYSVHTRGSTAVTTDYKRAGSYSMRASTSASTSTVQSQARRSVKAFGHRTSGDLWARYYYYLPSSVTLTDKFSSAVISEYEDPYFGFSVLIFPDGVGLESGGNTRRTTLTTFPRDQWVCVEMHVQISATAGVFEFYLNGTRSISLSGVDTLPDKGYTTFEAGVHYANFNQGAIDVYTDDVVLGTTRQGCN